MTDPAGLLATITTFNERGEAVSVDEVYEGQSHVTTHTYKELDLETSGLSRVWQSRLT